MPEGFSSIADLKVIVHTNTEKFHSGLQGILGSVDNLNRKGGSSFSGLADMVNLVGGAALGVTNKLKMMEMGVEAGIALYQNFASEGRKVAEVLGVTSEYDKLTEAIDDVGLSLKDAAVGAFFEMQSAVFGASGEMQTFASNTASAEQASQGFAAKLLTGVTSTINSVRLELRLLNAENAKSGAEIDKTITLLDEKIAGIRKKIAAMERGEIARYQASRATAGRMVDNTVELQKELVEAEAEKKRQLGIRARLPGQDWKDGATENISLLGGEILQRERLNDVLGKSAALAAEYNARVKAVDEHFRANGKLPDANQMRLIDIDAARIGQLAGEQEAFREAESARQKAAQQAEQKARMDKAAADRLMQSEDRMFVGGEREIQSLQQRARALEMTAGEAAELAMQERMMLQARSAGLAVDDAMLIKIKALSAEYGRQTEILDETMRAQRDMQQVAGIFSSTMQSAFSQWTSGAKVSVKDMVASVLADLARLTMQRSVLEPLFGGGSSKGAGLFGDLLGGLFGGFREGGGQVEAGKAYVVGEKRPELFVPQSNGTIIPNLGGAVSGNSGPSEVHVYVHASTDFDARVESTASNVVAREAPGIVGASVRAAEQMMPGMIMTGVRDGRDRRKM